MDSESKKFGQGVKELTGAVDLISQYKLLPYYDFFCKRSLPQAISETRYLHSVVGDKEIRKGEGMELNQLFENNLCLRETTTRIRPFELDKLRQAFNLRETAPVELSTVDKGRPTISGKVKTECKDKEKKHKKHKEKDREKDKDHKKHKHRHNERNKDKDKDTDRQKKKDKDGHHDSGGSYSKKHDDKKRKHSGSEDLADIHKQRKSKVELAHHSSDFRNEDFHDAAKIFGNLVDLTATLETDGAKT